MELWLALFLMRAGIHLSKQISRLRLIQSLTFRMVVGAVIDRITFTISELGIIHLLLTLNPKKVISSFRKWHFLSLIFKLYCS